MACKTEHQVPIGVNRTWVKYVEKGAWPDTRRFFSVMRCNHCTDAPCVTICPTRALFKRADGIVDFDTSRCIGCKSCMQACPYDALYIDPGEHTAQKCNYCVHRVEVGLEPACVVVCPEQAIIAGDLDDPSGRISRLVATEQTFVRAPEQHTSPNLFYLGVEEANLDPLSATVLTDGGLWREPAEFSPSGAARTAAPASPPAAPAGLPPQAGGDPRVVHDSSGRPRVTYNADHPMPWGWRVSGYFLTKGIAAGLALAAALALAAGVDAGAGFVAWGAPLVAGLFLALTGVLLVWDLKRPDRFYYLLTKGNPGSWLVRGAWILGAYAAVLGAWFLAGVAGIDGAVEALVWASLPLALATAGYTAFLFGQAEARDLWQSPTLLWHMLAGAFALGGAAGLALAVAGFEVGTTAEEALAWMLTAGVVALVALAVGEVVSRHPTRNVADAVHHMTRGRYAWEWRSGLLLLATAGALATFTATGLLGAWAGALGGLAAAAGVFAADDAMVRAGQGVPLS